jgi:hypothetical protein
MSGEFGSFRLGQDMETRISGPSTMLQEGTELLYGQLMYTPVPFVPITSGSEVDQTPVSSDGHVLWQRTPSACDLIFWQGDDVVIPLYFNDPALANDDMALGFEWYAQIRTLHSHRSTFVNDFVTHAEFRTGTSEDDEYTVVELFLPRVDNIYAGRFRWELYSINPTDYSRFPKPDDVDAADWPPPDALRTWLYGNCSIVPRVASTDVLPYAVNPSGATATIWNGDPYSARMMLGNGGFSVGPNGRVP